MRSLSLTRWFVAILLAVGVSGSAMAAVDTYAFQNEADRIRYRALVEELRCPKCQNQNIADSDAPIAMDLRREIHRMLAEGQSDEQIVNYLVDRYGDFVRYKPPVNGRTWLLWYGPWLLLGLGGVVLGAMVWRQRRPAAATPSSEKAVVSTLSSEESARLSTLLNDKAERP